jgi:hypothetical protein
MLFDTCFGTVSHVLSNIYKHVNLLREDNHACIRTPYCIVKYEAIIWSNLYKAAKKSNTKDSRLINTTVAYVKA